MLAVDERGMNMISAIQRNLRTLCRQSCVELRYSCCQLTSALCLKLCKADVRAHNVLQAMLGSFQLVQSEADAVTPFGPASLESDTLL